MLCVSLLCLFKISQAGGERALEDAPIVCESSADSLPDMSDWEFLDGVPDLPEDIDLHEDDPWIQSDVDSDHRALSG